MGLLFVLSGASKLGETVLFSDLIRRYGLLPDALIVPVARGLPLLELIAGVGLIFDIRGSLTATSGMLMLFMAVLSYGIFRGIDVGCACFGWGALSGMLEASPSATLLRDMVLLGVCAYLYYWRHANSEKASTQDDPSSA